AERHLAASTDACNQRTTTEPFRTAHGKSLNLRKFNKHQSDT
ncbi:MAG: hypothetical protein ACI9R8_001045, partial [Candidatus Paceibacteria bacterium]